MWLVLSGQCQRFSYQVKRGKEAANIDSLTIGLRSGEDCYKIKILA